MSFKETNIKDVKENLIRMIADDWMLVTSGDASGFNTMTASWGAAGVMWNCNIAATVIRPQRYTYKFLEQNDLYTLSFLKDGWKEALSFCGSHSGRDCDKCAETGLTPVFENGFTYFEQAKAVLVCRKLYVSDIAPEKFLDPALAEKMYPGADYHRAYVGKIEKVLIPA